MRVNRTGFLIHGARVYMMRAYFQRLKDTARRLAGNLPPPAFYIDYHQQYQDSRAFFDEDPVIAGIRQHALTALDDRMGHGWLHAELVSIDAGCLALVEAERLESVHGEGIHHLRLAQCAGLLHDIRRQERQHADAGAAEAERLLPSHGFGDEDIRRISGAIRNHVAFKPITPLADPLARLIADCLYDADKFRWGPDNFTHTVWEMVSAAAIHPEAFAKRYRRGVAYLKTIADTFRTPTGQAYGPEFIQQGLIIAEGLAPEVQLGIGSSGEDTVAGR